MTGPPSSLEGHAGQAGGPPGGDPPYVPIRRAPWPTSPAWPTRHAPRWLLLAAVLIVAGALLVALVHRPSQAQRASDLRGFVADMNADIQSCAGGVRDSLTALRQIQSGASHDVATAVTIANTGAANCSPANNELLDDLETYQVTESLHSLGLPAVVTGLVDWAAPDAEDVQTDVARVLAAPTPQARSKATAALQQARQKLDAQRAKVYAIVESASRSLSANVAPPQLPT
jgi:hypothetical protein